MPEDSYTRITISPVVALWFIGRAFHWSFKSWVVISGKSHTESINTLSQLSCKWCNQCLKEGRWRERLPKMIIRINLPRVTTNKAGVTPLAMIPASGKIPFPTLKETSLINMIKCKYVGWNVFSTTSDKWQSKTDVELRRRTFSSNVYGCLWQWFYCCDRQNRSMRTIPSRHRQSNQAQPTFNNQFHLWHLFSNWI